MKKKWLAAILSATVLVSSVTPATVMATNESGTSSASEDVVSEDTETSKAESAASTAESAASSTAESTASSSAESAASSTAESGSESTAESSAESEAESTAESGTESSEESEESEAETPEESEEEEEPESEEPKAVVTLSEDGKSAEIVLTDKEAAETEGAVLRFAVWSKENGQDDIRWECAAKQADGTFKKTIYFSDYNGYGTYHCHIYMWADGNDPVLRAYTDFEVPEPEQGVTAELSSDEKTITVTAVGIDSKATAVTFPTWSETKGQDDIVWAQAKKVSDGIWTADIPVKGHVSTGKYQIHCYQTVSGKSSLFGHDTVTVSKPKGTIVVEDVDDETGTFTARVTDLEVPAGVVKVQIPIWGETDDQNDLVWHKAKKAGDDYVVTTSAAAHQYESGTYNIHAYVTDENDIITLLDESTTEVKFKSGIVADVAEDQMTVDLALTGYTGTTIQAAVWSETDGQDDLVWYTMAKSGEGYTVEVPVTSHATSGTYQVHVYADNKLVTHTTFEIDPVAATTLEISNIDSSAGTFRATLSGITSASGVSKVRIPVWPTDNKDKIKWYTATKSGDSYYVNVKVSNHGNLFGDYTVHAYVYGNNGVSNYCTKTTTTVDADKYIYVESTGTYSSRVWIINPGSDVTGVKFPTWSNTNGQDDIVWYNATKSGNGWYADVKSANHKSGGNYTTHCYVTSSSGTDTLVGYVTYSLAKASGGSNAAMTQLAQSFSSSTQYLIMVDRTLHRVGIYQGSRYNWTQIKYWPCVVGAPATPTPTGEYQLKGRFYWFGEGHKCWWPTQIVGYYYFHSQIYAWGDTPETVIDATMDAAASHGCVRLYLDNAKWIWDNAPRGTTVYIYN